MRERSNIFLDRLVCFVKLCSKFSRLTKKVTYVVKSLEEIAMSKTNANRAGLLKMHSRTRNMGGSLGRTETCVLISQIHNLMQPAHRACSDAAICMYCMIEANIN